LVSPNLKHKETAVTFIRTTLLIVLVTLCACGEKQQDAPAIEGTTTEVKVNHAAVAMPDTFSADVASNILNAGGNAVDAAIAASFVLAVTEPEAGNIGGGGFMLIYLNDEAHFLDYRETAPLAAHRDMYLDEDGGVVEGLSRVGHLSAGVPGAVAGLWEAHQRFGSLPWTDLVSPAIALARDGFPVPIQLAEMGKYGASKYAGKTNFEKYFGSMQEGELFRQPELAATLDRIAEHGKDGFYSGETAQFIVSEMQRGNGLITAQDLDRYKAVWREPLRSDWREYEVLSAPPPSSGGFAVIQLLKIKDFLAHEFEGVSHNSSQYVHLVSEIEKRVFADRAEYLGDTDYVDVPMDQLLSDEYMRMRAREINPDEITIITDVTPGLESMETTHFSIVDRHGNAVSTTTTLNLSFGSGVIVEGAGFLLNDEMDDFSVKPGIPNAFGVVGNIANEIQPGKRMLSSMSPTILLKDNEVEMVVGTPGGSTIFTSVFQTIVNVIDYGMTPLEAVGATRFHHQLLPPDLITYSPLVPLADDTISQLSDLGYRPIPHPYSFGDVQVIVKDAESWNAASDPRKRGESRVMK
jgi:gamma-glutamyltranspeptidase/glutathione hydrolase